MILKEIRKLFVKDTGRWSDVPGWEDDDWTGPDADRFIVEGHKYVEDRLSYPITRERALLQVTQGQVLLDPKDVRYILSVELSDGDRGRALVQRSWDDLRGLYGDPFGNVEQGRPQYWCRNVPRRNATVAIKNGTFSQALDYWTVDGNPAPTAADGKVVFLSDHDRPRDIIYQILGATNPAGTEVDFTIASMAATGQFNIAFGYTANGQLPATLVHNSGRDEAGSFTETVPGDFNLIQISYQDNSSLTSTCVVTEVGVGLSGIVNPSFDDQLDGWEIEQGGPITPTGGQVTLQAWAPNTATQQVISQLLTTTYEAGVTATVVVSSIPEEDAVVFVIFGTDLEGGSPFIKQITAAGTHTFTVTEDFNAVAIFYSGPWNTTAAVDSIVVNVAESDLDPLGEGLIVIMPPAEKSYTANVTGAFFAEEPVYDNDETRLMAEEPFLVLKAAKAMSELGRHRNKEGKNVYLEEVDNDIQRIHVRRARERSAGPASTAVLNG